MSTKIKRKIRFFQEHGKHNYNPGMGHRPSSHLFFAHFAFRKITLFFHATPPLPKIKGNPFTFWYPLYPLHIPLSGFFKLTTL